jgi:RNA polymerase sigma-70 factor (ECF subfamily)
MSVVHVDDSFERWYRSAHRRVVAVLVAMGTPVDEASEAADEAAARALERWGRLSGEGDPTAWTIRVAINVTRRRARRRHLESRILRKQILTDVTEPPAGETWALVRSLPRRQREVLALRFIGDLTEAATAEALRISRSTVSSTTADALRALRRISNDEVEHVHD